MSKWKQISKTRRLKEKRNPITRVARITDLRREIKHYKDTLPSLKKKMEEYARAARWTRAEYEGVLENLAKWEKELNDLETYERNQQ